MWGLTGRWAVLAIVVLFAAVALTAAARGEAGSLPEPVVAYPFAYSTFVGGQSDDGGWAVAADGQGNAYIAGSTRSSDFPTTPGAFNRTAGLPSVGNGWVSKFDPQGHLVWSTLFGGDNSGDMVSGVAAFDRRICVVGTARGPEFPTTEGAYDRAFRGGNGDGFVACLDEAGDDLVYSTLLGGSDWDHAAAIAIDPTGAAWVMGVTHSTDFPTSPDGVQKTLGGMYDVFLARISPDGSQLLYSTFLGGDRNEWAYQMDLDPSGSPVVAGYTESPDFPTTPAALAGTLGGHSDGFVTRFQPDGRGLAFSTYLGGPYDDWVRGLDVGPAGVVYVTGRMGPGFPVTEGAFDTVYDGHKTFLTALHPNGTSLVFSTYLGGTFDPLGTTGVTSGGVVRAGASGGIWIGGATDAPAFVTTPDAFDDSFNGLMDAFLSLVSPDGGDVTYSTFLGGGMNDEVLASSFGPREELLLAGRVGIGFPTTPDAHDETANGASDAFLAALSLAPDPTEVTATPRPPVFGDPGQSTTDRFTVGVADRPPLAANRTSSPGQGISPAEGQPGDEVGAVAPFGLTDLAGDAPLRVWPRGRGAA